MGHMWEGTNIQLLLEELMIWWFSGQADISQLEMVATEEVGKSQMVMEINRIKEETLCSYNRKAIRMVFHLRISSWPGKMVQLAP